MKSKAYTLGPPEFIGRMPARMDLGVIPETSWQKFIRVLEKLIFDLGDLIPSVRKARDDAWYQVCKEDWESRKAAWAKGEATHFVPLGFGSRVPHRWIDLSSITGQR